MNLYNNGYPATYQQQLQQQQQQLYQQQLQQQQQMQAMTPPTIHAEIVQVENEDAAAAYPVGNGLSQMMMARDDSAIYIKSATAAGASLEVYVRRPPAPPAPKFEPGDYVRKDELESLIAAAIERKAAENEPV